MLANYPEIMLCDEHCWALFGDLIALVYLLLQCATVLAFSIVLNILINCIFKSSNGLTIHSENGLNTTATVIDFHLKKHS